MFTWYLILNRVLDRIIDKVESGAQNYRFTCKKIDEDAGKQKANHLEGIINEIVK